VAVRTTRTRAPDLGDWRARAACQNADPELFFPARAGADISAAVAICAGCSVRVECHKWAEATRQVHGVWAGVDRGDPQARRRARQAASAA
jgi:WhiB family redox-sensing transcriptional regulator